MIAGAPPMVGPQPLPYHSAASATHPKAPMSKKLAIAALLALAGAAQAQTLPPSTCSCDATPGATRTVTNADLVLLLTNRMVCGNVGGEKWQEWHNGSSSGPIVDYKLGPGVAPDPSTQVGTYAVSNNEVTYTYDGGGGTYKYEVCLASGGGSYTFCGAKNFGRDITGVKIGGSGLQNCSAVFNVPLPNTTGSRPRTTK